MNSFKSICTQEFLCFYNFHSSLWAWLWSSTVCLSLLPSPLIPSFLLFSTFLPSLLASLLFSFPSLPPSRVVLFISSHIPASIIVLSALPLSVLGLSVEGEAGLQSLLLWPRFQGRHGSWCWQSESIVPGPAWRGHCWALLFVPGCASERVCKCLFTVGVVHAGPAAWLIVCVTVPATKGKRLCSGPSRGLGMRTSGSMPLTLPQFLCL